MNEIVCMPYSIVHDVQ